MSQDERRITVHEHQPDGRWSETVHVDGMVELRANRLHAAPGRTVRRPARMTIRLASDLQCADKDVGVSDDAHHERVRDF